MRLVSTLVLLCGALTFAAPPSPTTWRDHRRKEDVVFPLGDRSFADEVVRYEPGTPGPVKERNRQPGEALGTPNDSTGMAGHNVTLGCGGTLELRFTDNALVDVDGPDLYVFEVGPAVEPTRLEVSVDGKAWLELGDISGGSTAVDLKGKVPDGDAFHYVRLVDLKKDCKGKTPGADIDAVGAIGSALSLSVSSTVLFDSGKAQLKPEATAALAELRPVLDDFPAARIVVAGHTDAQGSAAFNLKLSKDRAEAVRDALKLDGARVEVKGFGEGRPIASNDDEDGRQKNRRVEVLVVPR